MNDDDAQTRYLGPTGAASGNPNGATPPRRPRGAQQYFPPVGSQRQQYEYDPAYQVPQQPVYTPEPQYQPEPQEPAGVSKAFAIGGIVAAVLISGGAFFLLGRATGHQEPEQVEVTKTQVSTVTETTTVTEKARGLKVPSQVPVPTKLPDVEVPGWLQDLVGGDSEEPAPQDGVPEDSNPDVEILN